MTCGAPYAPDGRSMLSSEQILEMLRSAFAELFELEPARITLDARLAEDLEIDSIDAVDLIERVRRVIGRKVAPEDFRSVRTVGDLVQAIERLAKG
jgi:acyl carrier protein